MREATGVIVFLAAFLCVGISTYAETGKDKYAAVPVEKCSMSGAALSRLRVTGLPGAFVLGLSYGILSGSCTFGFIAPILAIITIQEKVALGILFILIFATGHCLPIVIAGSSGAAVRRLMENSTWQNAGNWFRKGAGAVIAVLAAYFILNPFFTV